MAVNDYLTVAQLKSAMPDSGLDNSTSYDALITFLITRASRLIDSYLHRHPGAFYVNAGVTRYYDGSGGSEQWVDEMAAAPTLVAVSETGGVGASDYTTWASTDYHLWPYNALEDGIPYNKLIADVLNGTKTTFYRFFRSVKITSFFGFSAAVPGEIAEAVTIQTGRWFKRGHQGFADASAIVELGRLVYTQKLDPDVETLLSAPKFQRITI